MACIFQVLSPCVYLHLETTANGPAHPTGDVDSPWVGAGAEAGASTPGTRQGMSLSGEWLQLSPFSTPLPRIRGGGFHRLSPPHRQAAPLRPASRRGRDGACVFKVGPPRTPALPGARRLACRSWGFGPVSLPPPSSFERSGRSRAGARGSRPSLGGHLGPGAAGVWSGTQRRERGAHAGNRCTSGECGGRRPAVRTCLLAPGSRVVSGARVFFGARCARRGRRRISLTGIQKPGFTT